MKKNLQKLYHLIIPIPALGNILKFAWQKFQFSIINKYLLKRKDKRRAREIAIQLFGIQGSGYLDEFIHSELFNSNYSYGHSGDFDVMLLYTIVRATKPNTVLETGVASGRSSAAILSALDKNKHGQLFSIDLPQYFSDSPSIYTTEEGNNELTGFVPEGQKPGWLVPEILKERWNLILGDAKSELPRVLDRLDSVDVFYHDSDHSEEHMMFEFKNVYPRLSSKGFFLSDDVSWNDAWKEFMNKNPIKEIAIYRNFGIARIKN